MDIYIKSRTAAFTEYRANTAMGKEVMYVMCHGFRLLYPKRSGR